MRLVRGQRPNKNYFGAAFVAALCKFTDIPLGSLAASQPQDLIDGNDYAKKAILK